MTFDWKKTDSEKIERKKYNIGSLKIIGYEDIHIMYYNRIRIMFFLFSLTTIVECIAFKPQS